MASRGYKLIIMGHTNKLVSNPVPVEQILRAVDDGVDKRHERRLVVDSVSHLKLRHNNTQLAALVRHFLE